MRTPNIDTGNYAKFTWAGVTRAIYYDALIGSVPQSKKVTISQIIGDLIGIQSSQTLKFGNNLNGEFKEMILVRTRHIGGVYSERQGDTNGPLVPIHSEEVETRGTLAQSRRYGRDASYIAHGNVDGAQVV